MNRSILFKIKLIFINSLSKYNPNSALDTQLQGSMHTAADSTRPLRTQLQILFPPLQPKTRTYQLRSNSSSKRTCYFSKTKTDFTLRASLYLYNPMVCRPWVGWPYNILIYITLGRTTLHFCAPHPHFAGSLHCTWPKFGLQATKTYYGGIRYPTRGSKLLQKFGTLKNTKNSKLHYK